MSNFTHGLPNVGIGARSKATLRDAAVDGGIEAPAGLTDHWLWRLGMNESAVSGSAFAMQTGEVGMGILGWIVFGLIVGALAKLVMPGKDPGGFVVTALLGIVGALVGGFVGRALGLYGPNDPAGFVMALIGAILLLVLYRTSIGRRTA
jgi:uncharacterized membrane protein YeaQ/YmgE (transglycosylase-associated protein family)